MACGSVFSAFTLLAELNVFGVEAVDVFAHPLDFVLRPAHGDKSMRAENIVYDQREHKQAQDGAAMLSEKFVKSVLRAFLRYASTHLVASLVKRLEAFGLSAST